MANPPMALMAIVCQGIFNKTQHYFLYIIVKYESLYIDHLVIFYII